MKSRIKLIKQYYELILYLNGGVVERVKTDSFATYKGEYERLDAVTSTKSSYNLVVNIYDANNQFEKRIK